MENNSIAYSYISFYIKFYIKFIVWVLYSKNPAAVDVWNDDNCSEKGCVERFVFDPLS